MKDARDMYFDGCTFLYAVNKNALIDHSALIRLLFVFTNSSHKRFALRSKAKKVIRLLSFFWKRLSIFRIYSRRTYFITCDAFALLSHMNSFITRSSIIITASFALMLQLTNHASSSTDRHNCPAEPTEECNQLQLQGIDFCAAYPCVTIQIHWLTKNRPTKANIPRVVPGLSSDLTDQWTWRFDSHHCIPVSNVSLFLAAVDMIWSHRLEFRFHGREQNAFLSFCLSGKEFPESDCLVLFSMQQKQRFTVFTFMRISVGGESFEWNHEFRYSKLLDIFMDGNWHFVRLEVEQSATPQQFVVTVIVDDRFVTDKRSVTTSC